MEKNVKSDLLQASARLPARVKCLYHSSIIIYFTDQDILFLFFHILFSMVDANFIHNISLIIKLLLINSFVYFVSFSSSTHIISTLDG